MLRAIREISPRFVVGENVRGLLSWNGGMVFDEVCVELENLGYQVAPVVIPAAGVNAPHRRERIWFVAYAKDRGHRGWLCEQCSNGEWELFQNQQGGSAGWCEVAGCCGIWNATNTNRDGFNERNGNNEINTSEGREYALGDINTSNVNGNTANTESNGRKNALENRELERGRFGFTGQRHSWDAFPSQSPICSGDDGVPTELDGITFSKWRQESVKGFGNAIVPQVAFEIFKAIQQCDNKSLL
jgi:DNA (cytosine-5)-methyltransferase 1